MTAWLIVAFTQLGYATLPFIATIMGACVICGVQRLTMPSSLRVCFAPWGQSAGIWLLFIGSPEVADNRTMDLAWGSGACRSARLRHTKLASESRS